MCALDFIMNIKEWINWISTNRFDILNLFRIRNMKNKIQHKSHLCVVLTTGIVRFVLFYLIKIEKGTINYDDNFDVFEASKWYHDYLNAL